MAESQHRVEVSCEGRVVTPISYEFSTSMVQPADAWSIAVPYSRQLDNLLSVDAAVTISIDGVVQMTGYIDDTEYSSQDGLLSVHGRDKMGRVVQESIPTVSGFDGLLLDAAVLKAAAPWFSKVSFSDARNRAVRRGKGGKAASSEEGAIFNVRGKLDEEHSGRLEPGETRWNLIEQLSSSISVLCWSSVDGRELIIGAPNYKQDPQYYFQRGTASCTNITVKRSVRDRYAMIEMHGSGVGGDEDFGAATVSKLGTAFDGPNPDGTGRDFKRPKRLALTHRAIGDNGEGIRGAQREMNRRNFSRHQLVIEAGLHGQRYRGSALTLFATNTLARVQDDVKGFDDTFLIYQLVFRGGRNMAETTQLSLVPRGTVFVS